MLPCMHTPTSSERAGSLLRFSRGSRPSFNADHAFQDTFFFWVGGTVTCLTAKSVTTCFEQPTRQCMSWAAHSVSLGGVGAIFLGFFTLNGGCQDGRGGQSFRLFFTVVFCGFVK